LGKILNEKVFINKKAILYAIKLNNKSKNKSHNKNNINNGNCSSEYNNGIEKIIGWNYNEKNPFLSLIHFESYLKDRI